MRRFLAIAAACLLLTGCGQNQVDAMISEPEQNGLLLEQEEITENASIKLATEWDVYDPSVEEIWFWIENDSGNDVTFGQEYTLENGWRRTVGFRTGTRCRSGRMSDGKVCCICLPPAENRLAAVGCPYLTTPFPPGIGCAL